MSIPKGFIIWICASFFYLYQYIVRVVPKVMMPEIISDFDISATFFGQFSGIYYISYSLMHIPVGMMLDKFDLKKVMPICMFLTALGLLPIVYIDNFYASVAGRFITGFGSTAAILGIFKTVNTFFPQNIFSRMVSVSVSIGLMGALYAGEPMVILKNDIGYENVIKLLAIVGFVLAIITYLAITPSQKSVAQQKGVWERFLGVLVNYKFVIYCILAGLMVGPLEGFADVWGVQYLIKTHGFDEKVAGNMTSMIFMGMMMGAIFLVYIADKTNSHNLVNCISGIAMVLCLVGIMFYIKNEHIIFALMFIIGIFCAYQITAIYFSTRFLDEDSRTIGSSIANMIIMLFGYFFHSVIGSVLTFAKDSGIAEIHAWQTAIAVIPVCLAIGAIGTFSYKFVRRSI